MKGAKATFTTDNGEVKCGHIIYEYYAFEGEKRYIIHVERDQRDYRCVRTKDGYKECVI